jgi:hypothetical protein
MVPGTTDIRLGQAWGHGNEIMLTDSLRLPIRSPPVDDVNSFQA